MARLGDICTIVSGTTPKSSIPEYWDGDINWITPAELNDDSYIINESVRRITDRAVKESSLKSFPAGTVILSSRAPIGKVAIAGTEMYCNQGFKNLICSDKINNRYLYWFLKCNTEYLNSLGRGATFKEISKGIVENIEINLPPLNQQIYIAGIFEKLSSIIAIRKKQISQLDQLVKSQFIEMFCTQNKWADCKIEDLCLSARTGPFGSALHHDEFVDEGIFVLGIDNAVENKFSYKRMRYITPEKYEQLKRYTVHPGDVIITIMGTVGRSAVIPEDIPTAINTKHLACLTLNKQLVNPYFLCNAFQIHPDIVHQLTGQATGAIMDGLNLTKIKNVHFHCPPVGLQNEFVELYHKADKSKFAIQQSLEQLETLKKSLMQEYFG